MLGGRAIVLCRDSDNASRDRGYHTVNLTRYKRLARLGCPRVTVFDLRHNLPVLGIDQAREQGDLNILFYTTDRPVLLGAP